MSLAFAIAQDMPIPGAIEMEVNLQKHFTLLGIQKSDGSPVYFKAEFKVKALEGNRLFWPLSTGGGISEYKVETFFWYWE